MKLRIRGNSIRLRLSKSEVKKFGAIGRVEETIQFGQDSGGDLIYVLTQADVPKLQCEFQNNIIQIFVPTELAKVWVETDLVGLEHLDKITAKDSLRILVEKDFKCLHVRFDEDEADTYRMTND
ncbi:MAG: hypothetical protein AAF573_15745 [Bacteroidota bacterium]